MAIFRVPILQTFTDPGSPGVNVFHVRTGGVTPAAAALQAAVDSIRTFYVDLTSTTLSTFPPYAGGAEFTLGTVVNVETQEAMSPTFTPRTWASATPDLPPSNQICIGWKTTIAARRGTGRTYIGPLNDNAKSNSGSISTTTRDHVLAAAQAFVDRSLVDNDWAIAIYGLQTANSGPTGAKVARDITSRRVGTKFAVLRSRRD